MKQAVIAALTFLALFAAPVAAGEDAERSIFDMFHGEWQSNGPAFGATALSQMAWAPTLDSKYFRLDY